MLVTKPYDRERAVVYARKWALARNPLFNDFSGIGGNCTNFVSQCLYAGCCVMNFTPVFGWYYLDAERRTASWTGVEFLYNYLTQNTGEGPFATEVVADGLQPGDVIQLGREGTGYYHSLLVVGAAEGDYLVAAHSEDSLDRPLSTYQRDLTRYIHIDAARLAVPSFSECFDMLLAGIGLAVNGEVPLPPGIADAE